jgi:hypothetical protein
MKIPMRLFGAFKPTEWTEDTYIRRPPFVIETVSGRVSLVPRDGFAESTLDGISSSLGLKKPQHGHGRYMVPRGLAIKALREFDWYVRRSWRAKSLAALWALAYLGEKGDWSQNNLQLQDMAEASGLTTKECQDALHDLFHSKLESGSTQSMMEFASDRRLIQQTLEKAVDDLPLWTEEKVMTVLCTGPGGSAAELYEAVLAQGISIGAVYKVAERLKTQGYVYPQTHYRVNERGPMREMLAADCRNCFFGYTNTDTCLQDTLRQIEDVIERDYGKKPTGDQRAAMLGSLKAVPFAAHTNRKVLSSLNLMHELDRASKEGSVSSMLKRVEEGYGVELPVKAIRKPN